MLSLLAARLRLRSFVAAVSTLGSPETTLTAPAYTLMAYFLSDEKLIHMDSRSYMGKNSPPLAAISEGSDLAKSLTRKSGKGPRSGGSSETCSLSGTRTVLLKETVRS